MKKNQKYTSEEMYMAIELWRESGLSQYKYCERNQISFSTFQYWQKKFQKDKLNHKVKSLQPFISVDVPSTVDMAVPVAEAGCITIFYPNGIQVSCPAHINHEQLRTLIKL
jgi:transposase-like protein